MRLRRTFTHQRGDYSSAGIALGAVFGAAAGVLIGDAAIGVGAAVGAGAGLVLGAVIDAWADHPHGPGRRHRPPAGMA